MASVTLSQDPPFLTVQVDVYSFGVILWEMASQVSFASVAMHLHFDQFIELMKIGATIMMVILHHTRR